MKYTTISQRTEIEPIRVDVYKCPVEGCKALLDGVTYEQAKAHVNQPIDVSLPKGLVFSRTVNYYGIVISNRSNQLNLQHSPVYAIDVFSKGLPNRLISAESISSNIFREDVLSGKSSFLDEMQFQEFNKDFAQYLFERKITPVRTTPELEKMLAEAKR